MKSREEGSKESGRKSTAAPSLSACVPMMIAEMALGSSNTNGLSCCNQ